ncbi:MAG TPA: serine/threonine-protein kinase, partial [Kribbella sp.]|nr:serine/threonine-protein kinase [Kribbella sp.]
MADVFAGRFELLDPIGVGGAGTVWRAWDRRQERFCAAKVLRQRDAGALLRFVREQGRRLDHPNVLSPYGWAADDDLALLAMDLVGGGSVDHLVADFGPLPPRLAAELLSQLLGALDKIHTAGVVHRDVKPANLLLETTGTARPMLRLSDFGIAIALGEPRLTVHGTVVGTPGYLAPEALAGAAPSPAQDLYAAGVTAWQLLTGAEPPERGAPPPPPVDADDPIWTVVTALTSPDPSTRPESAAAALADLAPTLAEPLVLPVRTPDGEVVEVFNHLPPLPPHHTQPPTAPTLELPPDPPSAPDAPARPAPERAV